MIKSNLQYNQLKDYLIPDLQVMEKQVRAKGKYAIARENFLMEHKKGLFDRMVATETLIPHLNQVQQDCEEQLEIRVQNKMRKDNLTEQMKAQDQMKWVQMMNLIKMEVESEIMRELVLV
ncbi:MAG: TnpV protein [Bacilli bacterium]|nr:TnpV protein [Bacilli bacterium]